MARLSHAKRRLARTRRANSVLHRDRRRLLNDMSPIIRRANFEGHLLRLMLEDTPVTIHKSKMSETLRGDIDVAAVPDSDYYEIRYIPTPIEASKAEPPVEPVEGTTIDMTIVDAEGPYAEPEAAV